MIQKDNITDKLPELSEIRRKVNFWRTAASGNFDQGKWVHMGNLEKLRKDVKATEEDEFLIKFEFESPRSYGERMVLSNDFGFSKDIIDAYTQLARKAEKSIEIKGLSTELETRFRENIDSNGTTWAVYFAEAFEELLKVGRIFGATDSFQVSPETEGKKAVFMPLSYLIPRENIRNFVSGGETFKFITWDSVEQSAVGIKRIEENVIIIMTDEEIAIARKRDKGNWKVVELIPHNIGHPPVRDAWFGADAMPIIDIISKLQFNLFNLDSEMRKGMRSQVGMALLEIDESVKLDVLTDKSFIQRTIDTIPTRWVEPVGSSYAAHFQYEENIKTFIRNLSRLRSQKNSAETAHSKALDFTMVEAVYNAAVDAIKPFIEQQVKDWGAFSGTEATAKITVDRELDFTPAQEAIQTLLQELSAGLGQTAESKLKKMYRDRQLNLSPEELKQSDEEIDEPEPDFLGNTVTNETIQGTT